VSLHLLSQGKVKRYPLNRDRDNLVPRHSSALPLGIGPWVAAFLVLLLAACNTTQPPVPEPPRAKGPGETAVYVTSNGWHSGIVVASADMVSGLVPETADFPEARFFEFGWGDAAYYPAREATLGMTLSAALVPTPAVVHVVGLDRHPADAFPEAEVATLAIGAQGLGRLLAFIDASFARNGAKRVAASGPGLYRNSRFYPATGQFHLFNTCNTWTAKALVAAGIDVDAGAAARAEGLMKQLRSRP